jgi:hypothetical protein
MLVDINATGETLYLLVVTSDKSTLGVPGDGIEDGIDFKVHVGKSLSVGADIFHDCLRDVLIHTIEEFRQTSDMVDSPGILLINNCSAHIEPATFQLLSDYHMKAIAFPPHISAIFQMLNFGLRI